MDVTGTTGQDVPEKVPRSCHPSMGEKERRTAFSLNFSWAKPGDHDALSTGGWISLLIGLAVAGGG